MCESYLFSSTKRDFILMSSMTINKTKIKQKRSFMLQCFQNYHAQLLEPSIKGIDESIQSPFLCESEGITHGLHLGLTLQLHCKLAARTVPESSLDEDYNVKHSKQGMMNL